MITRRIKPISEYRGFSDPNYKIENKNYIHIIDLQFETPFSITSIYFWDMSDDLKPKEIYKYNFNRSSQNNESIDPYNISEFLNFKSTFNRELGIRVRDFVLDNHNLPNLIITYIEVETLTNYYIDLQYNIFFLSCHKGLVPFSQYYNSETLIGIKIELDISEIDDIVENITLSFYDGTIVCVDLYDCRFLGYSFYDDFEYVKYIIPLTPNLFDIFYCIKNNLKSELEQEIKNIILDKHKSKIITLNSPDNQHGFNSVAMCAMSCLKDIRFNDKTLYKENFRIGGLFLKEEDYRKK